MDLPPSLAVPARQPPATALSRFPRYEISSPVVRAYSSNVRGLARLPIVLEPRS